MEKISDFVRKEQLYILLLIFIILLNVFGMTSSVQKRAGHAKAIKAQASKMTDDLFMKPADAEKILHEKRHLALLLSLASLLIIATFLLGVLIDALLVSGRLSGRRLDILTNKLPAARWNIWDVAKVVILFIFFGYMIVMIEYAVSRLWPSIKNSNFRMVLNSSVLDVLTAVFILYFTVGQYKERLVSLGLSLKNFGRNVYYGVVGYVATVPALVGTLIAIAIIINITKYVPERQPVVDLFMKEKDTAFLAYTTVFAAVMGPVVEELFFRGFLYGALKKYIGVFWSVLITAALFAALHTNVVGFLPIMVLGVVLAYVYEKTGTLVPSMTIHAIHNFTMVLFVFLVRQLKV